jgi:thiamine kinase-like enzyme
LDTRPEEFEMMEEGLLKSKAHDIDQRLNQCQFQTIVHGDAKLANFCFSEDGKEVAAVDFQYVGGGCGMKEVAYFLGSCLSSDECVSLQDELLDYYFECLKVAVIKHHEGVDVNTLEIEWREMYPIASIDFTRFLMGWMPTHQKLNAYTLKIMNTVLSKI